MSYLVFTLKLLASWIAYSVLSHLIEPMFIDSQWTKEQIIIAAVTYLIDFLVVFIVIAVVAILIAKIPSKNAKKSIAHYLNIALLISMLVLILSMLSGWYLANKEPKKLGMAAPATDDSYVNGKYEDSIQVFTTVQSSDGATSADLDIDALKYLEEWVVDTNKKRMLNTFVQSGGEPANFSPSISSESLYVVKDGSKLGIIKMTVEHTINMVSIIGILGKELHRVSCINAAGGEVDIWSGECGVEVQKTFGVNVGL